MNAPRRSIRAIAGILSLSSVLAALPSPAEAQTGDTLATLAPAIDRELVDETTEPPARSRDVWAARPFAVLGHVQTVGPFGVFGISGEYAFNPIFSAALGVGMSSHPQGNAMARFRLPLDDHFGAGVGLGASYGKPFTLDLCLWAPCTPRDEPAVVSGDTELFVEGRATNGFTARLYGGVHQQLGAERRMNGYFGIAGGWAF